MNQRQAVRQALLDRLPLLVITHDLSLLLVGGATVGVVLGITWGWIAPDQRLVTIADGQAAVSYLALALAMTSVAWPFAWFLRTRFRRRLRALATEAHPEACAGHFLWGHAAELGVLEINAVISVIALWQIGELVDIAQEPGLWLVLIPVAGYLAGNLRTWPTPELVDRALGPNEDPPSDADG